MSDNIMCVSLSWSCFCNSNGIGGSVEVIVGLGLSESWLMKCTHPPRGLSVRTAATSVGLQGCHTHVWWQELVLRNNRSYYETVKLKYIIRLSKIFFYKLTRCKDIVFWYLFKISYRIKYTSWKEYQHCSLCYLINLQNQLHIARNASSRICLLASGTRLGESELKSCILFTPACI